MNMPFSRFINRINFVTTLLVFLFFTSSSNAEPGNAALRAKDCGWTDEVKVFKQRFTDENVFPSDFTTNSMQDLKFRVVTEGYDGWSIPGIGSFQESACISKKYKTEVSYQAGDVFMCGEQTDMLNFAKETLKEYNQQFRRALQKNNSYKCGE